MTIHKSVSELIGGTPLVELSNYEKNHNLEATIVGKVGAVQPARSAKDRIAKAMLDQAEAEGKLDADTVIIEPTSGNTGIGLCSLAAARGNRIIITMPETMSVERRNLMKAYGAELVLTDGSKGMKGAIARASELAEEIPNSFIPSQFTNPANPAVHERTTGPEIWADTDGKVDILVAGVGTGGTLSGTGKYLKSQNPDIQVVAVEPAGSPVLCAGHGGRAPDPGHRRRLRARGTLDQLGPATRSMPVTRRGGVRGRPRAGGQGWPAGGHLLRRRGCRRDEAGATPREQGQADRGGAPRHRRRALSVHGHVQLLGNANRLLCGEKP